MQNAHTPGPVILQTRDSGEIVIVDSATEGRIIAVIPKPQIRFGVHKGDTLEENQANAAELVRRWNNHVALDEALQRAEYALRHLTARMSAEEIPAPVADVMKQAKRTLAGLHPNFAAFKAMTTRKSILAEVSAIREAHPARRYYYAPNGNGLFECKGFGAEDRKHLAVYLPFYTRAGIKPLVLKYSGHFVDSKGKTVIS